MEIKLVVLELLKNLLVARLEQLLYRFTPVIDRLQEISTRVSRSVGTNLGMPIDQEAER